MLYLSFSHLLSQTCHLRLLKINCSIPIDGVILCDAMWCDVCVFLCYVMLCYVMLCRAIGDVALQPYVTCIPEILDREIQSEDEFLVLASDGLWVRICILIPNF